MAKRLTEKQKAKKLAKYRQLREDGKTAVAAAKAVGVAYFNLVRWEKEGGRRPKKVGKKAGRKPGSRRVAAAVEAPAPASARLTLTTPEGYMIEADRAEDVVAVLKGLK